MNGTQTVQSHDKMPQNVIEYGFEIYFKQKSNVHINRLEETIKAAGMPSNQYILSCTYTAWITIISKFKIMGQLLQQTKCYTIYMIRWMSQYKRVYENEIKKTETENNNVKMPNSKVVRDTAKNKTATTSET